jgi:hypothetical protein
MGAALKEVSKASLRGTGFHPVETPATIGLSNRRMGDEQQQRGRGATHRTAHHKASQCEIA